MPSRDHTRSRHMKESQFHTIYNGDPGEPQIDRRTKQIGKPGYFQCPECGNWARIRRDGLLYVHLTGGLANVKCVYQGIPKGQVEQVRITYTMTFTVEREVVVHNVHSNPRLTPNGRNTIFREAVMNDIPEVLEFRPDGVRMDLQITEARNEVVSVEETA